MKVTLLLTVLLFLSSQLMAQQIQHLNPAGLSKSPNYTQVVTVQGGRTVYISGQVPVNAQGELIGKGDFPAQVKQVYENIRTALSAAGATFDDVIKTTTLVVSSDDTKLATVRQIRSQYYTRPQPPASTYFGVQALYDKDVMIEIEVIAVVKEKMVLRK